MPAALIRSSTRYDSAAPSSTMRIPNSAATRSAARMSCERCAVTSSGTSFVMTLPERLEVQVSRGPLVLRAGLLGDVLLRLEQVGAEQRHGFRARARGLAGGGEAVGAEGHGDHRERHEHRVVHLVAARLHHHRLARHEGRRRVARVHRRHAVRAEPGDQRITGVVGVDGAQLGLHRRARLDLHLVLGLVHRAGEADDRVRVDQPRRGGLGAEQRVAGRHGRGRRGADLLDPPVGADEHHAVGNRRPMGRMEGTGAHGDLRTRGTRRQHHAGHHRRRAAPPPPGDPCPEHCRDSSPMTRRTHHWSSSSSACSRSPRPAPSPPTATRWSSGRDRSNRLRPSTHVCSIRV